MRYSYDHKPAIRRNIVATAARRYRAEGIQSVGIANLMADLGLTHGGFYTHFKDKESLVAEVCRDTLQAQRQRWQEAFEATPHAALQAIVSEYLSEGHKDRMEDGCPIPALAGELARRDNPSRQAFTEGISGLLGVLQDSQPKTPMSVPIGPHAMLSMMVGALLLARAVSDESTSQAFLHCVQLPDVSRET